MSADKRTVSTDALETLGTIIGPNEKRDAIHLAVIPAIAGHDLAVGADVFLTKNGIAYHYGPDPKYIGIVDPFLKGDELVQKGQRFWLVIYPRKITSLRHVWTHPDIPDDGDSKPVHSELRIAAAREHLEEVAADAGLEYDEFMQRLDDAIEGKNYYVSAEHGYEPDSPLNDLFWANWSIVTGKPVPPGEDKPQYFSCSC